MEQITHKIIIENFGPIQKIELEVKDILIFIGPQASGKSTISKSIYFFRSLKDDLLRHVLDSIEEQDFEKTLGTYGRHIRRKFLEFWGPTKNLQAMLLQYDYGNGASITVNLRGQYVNPIFNQKFKDHFFQIIQEAKDFSGRTGRQNLKFLSSSEILAVESERRVFFERLEILAGTLFNDKRDHIFIPAGRSLLATLSDQLQNIRPDKLDYLTRSFIERINNSKPLFSKGFDELISDKKQLTRDKIDFESLGLARQIIEDILMARYQFDTEGEKLFFEVNRFTKLNYASSGQQESIWILLLIFLLILDNQQVFIVLEEPEAHLYPKTQKKIVELMSLLAGLQQNQIVITTHSPYILSSFNNLIYAHTLGQVNTEAVNKLVNQRIWTDPSRVGAFALSDGKLINIIDEDVQLIQAEAIDSASDEINDTYHALFELDNVE